MRKVFAVTAILFFSFLSIGLADQAPVYIPIESISLTYDLKTQTLHVTAHHPSVNPSVEYIRMMTVSLNGQEVSRRNYDHQNGQDFSDDVPIAANLGDAITVTLYCTGGMSKSQDLTVTDSQAQGTDAGADNQTENAAL